MIARRKSNVLRFVAIWLAIACTCQSVLAERWSCSECSDSCKNSCDCCEIDKTVIVGVSYTRYSCPSLPVNPDSNDSPARQCSCNCHCVPVGVIFSSIELERLVRLSILPTPLLSMAYWDLSYFAVRRPSEVDCYLSLKMHALFCRLLI